MFPQPKVSYKLKVQFEPKLELCKLKSDKTGFSGGLGFPSVSNEYYKMVIIIHLRMKNLLSQFVC